MLALAPERFNAIYSGTKAFMLNLSMALRTELANTGIRVQAVLPGATRTEIWGKAGVDIAAMPADRLMDADEMVDAALAGLDIGEAVTIPSLAGHRRVVAVQRRASRDGAEFVAGTRGRAIQRAGEAA